MPMPFLAPLIKCKESAVTLAAANFLKDHIPSTPDASWDGLLRMSQTQFLHKPMPENGDLHTLWPTCALFIHTDRSVNILYLHDDGQWCILPHPFALTNPVLLKEFPSAALRVKHVGSNAVSFPMGVNEVTAAYAAYLHETAKQLIDAHKHKRVFDIRLIDPVIKRPTFPEGFYLPAWGRWVSPSKETLDNTARALEVFALQARAAYALKSKASIDSIGAHLTLNNTSSIPRTSTGLVARATFFHLHSPNAHFGEPDINTVLQKFIKSEDFPIPYQHRRCGSINLHVKSVSPLSAHQKLEIAAQDNPFLPSL